MQHLSSEAWGNSALVAHTIIHVNGLEGMPSEKRQNWAPKQLVWKGSDQYCSQSTVNRRHKLVYTIITSLFYGCVSFCCKHNHKSSWWHSSCKLNCWNHSHSTASGWPLEGTKYHIIIAWLKYYLLFATFAITLKCQFHGTGCLKTQFLKELA